MNIYTAYLMVYPQDSYYICEYHHEILEDIVTLGGIHDMGEYQLVLYAYTNKKSMMERFIAMRDKHKFYLTSSKIDKDEYSTLTRNYSSLKLVGYKMSSKGVDPFSTVITMFEMSDIEIYQDECAEMFFDSLYPGFTRMEPVPAGFFNSETMLALTMLGYAYVSGCYDDDCGMMLYNDSVDTDVELDDLAIFIELFGDTLPIDNEKR